MMEEDTEMNTMMMRFNDVYTKLNKNGNINSVISPKMAEDILFSESLYYNDIRYIPWLRNAKTTRSLRLPSVLCREVANVVCSEFDLSVSGENARAEYLNNRAQSITRYMPRWTEKALAMGNLAFKPFTIGEDIYIKACELGDYVPLRIREDGTIDSVAFVSTICRSDKWYTRIEYHHKEVDKYTIENKAYFTEMRGGTIGAEIPLDTVPEWADIYPMVELDSSYPMLFGIYKSPCANTVDKESMLGVSLYSQCYDLFKEVDELWESIQFEMKSGERRIFAPDGAYVKMGGERRRLSRFYQEVDMEQELFKDFSPPFRNQFYSERLQEVFKRIEENSGLAYGTISDPLSVERTATEVKHSKERMQATVTAIQTELQYALQDTITAVNAVCDIYDIAPGSDYETVFTWDDSVIESRQEKSDRAMMEYQMGWIDEADYFMQTRGMTRDEADAYVDRMGVKTAAKKGVWFQKEQQTAPIPTPGNIEPQEDVL
jgi:A118 family predicted phage portal protein